jgi:hypothetical protein
MKPKLSHTKLLTKSNLMEKKTTEILILSTGYDFKGYVLQIFWCKIAFVSNQQKKSYADYK